MSPTWPGLRMACWQKSSTGCDACRCRPRVRSVGPSPAGAGGAAAAAAAAAAAVSTAFHAGASKPAACRDAVPICRATSKGSCVAAGPLTHRITQTVGRKHGDLITHAGTFGLGICPFYPRPASRLSPRRANHRIPRFGPAPLRHAASRLTPCGLPSGDSTLPNPTGGGLIPSVSSRSPPTAKSGLAIGPSYRTSVQSLHLNMPISRERRCADHK